MSELPPAEPSNPTCGACVASLVFGDDAYECEGCLLWFDNNLNAMRDEDEPVCGHACSNTWHEPGKINLDYTYQCGTCQLTQGHTAEHWTGCVPVKIGAAHV